MNGFKATLVIVGLLSLGAPAAAQAQCTLASTYRECLEIENARADLTEEETATLKNAARERTEAQSLDDLAAMNTGTNASATQSDFVSKLGFALDSLNFGANGDEALALDWNGFVQDILEATFFENLADVVPGEHKLTLEFTDPVLYEPLAKLLSAEQKEQVGGEIKDLDDTTIKWSISPFNKRYGRNFAAFSDDFGILFNESFEKDVEALVGADTARDAFGELTIALRRGDNLQTTAEADFLQSQGIDPENLTEMSLLSLQALCQKLQTESNGCPYAANVEHIVARIAGITRAQAEIEANIQQRLDTGVFATWRKLVDNQPQVVISVEHTNREKPVGPDQTSGKLTYEFGKYNMNDFRDFSRDYTACGGILECVTAYAAENQRKIDMNLRFSLSLEYVQTDDFLFMRAGMPTLQLDDERSIVFGSALSRDLDTSSLISPALTGGKPAQAELTLAYDDADNDAQRNDRLVAKLTFTQQLRDSTYLTLGFVYSSKPEYRGQVDKEISARFGLNYKIGSTSSQK